MDLVDIRSKIDTRYSSIDSDLKELVHDLDGMEFVHKYRIRDGILEVIYEPIVLVSHDGTDSINLGRLIVKIKSNRTFTVARDSTSGRDMHLMTGQTHPHVDGGHVCLGNALELPEALGDNSDISIFVVLMHSFLLQYSNGNPYWKPFIYDPCRICPRDFKCDFCRCYTCGSRTDSSVDCSSCRDAGCLNSTKICEATSSRVYKIRDSGKFDNYQLIEIYDSLEKFEV